MDIIIRDVEEKDGQYKIYNKDGTGGHWYITKESAEKVSGQIEPQVMPKIADRTLIAHIRDNKITLQTADYVEDGNLIKIDGNKIELYEIPYGGGDEQFFGKFNTIIEAIAEGDTLT